MKMHEFQKTGLKISAIGIGTWGIGGAGWGNIIDEQSIEAIRTMIDHGVNLVDTAPVYGLGHAEEVVGKALSGGYRQKVILVSKAGITRKKATGFGKNEGPVRDSSPAMIRKQVEESLTRLKTDYLDVLLIHWPDVHTPFAETAEAMKQLKKEGKIRFSGVCNFDPEQAEEFYQTGALDFMQDSYSMVDRKNEALMKKMLAQGVITMAYGALGGGILTGAYRSIPSFSADDMRTNFYHYFEEPAFSKIMKLLNVMDEIASEHHVPVSQVAINWTAENNPAVGVMLAGVSKPRHAEEDCAALEWTMSEEERKKLNQAVETYIDF